ncbi:hypothetical protein PPYR_01703 [Photinus pyralis]|uniref:Chitin-binding type-2 domain-containing protein n=1 Tax=Photinus pyralis TaxID=7054 RepID=A0A5N4B5B4_PHOPY|nr:U-scoloptoxin(01)-Er1a-like [Photinus pyralis]KAB0804733.1 hypothetical protein PPYR_01703 [Photinus pyralis]
MKYLIILPLTFCIVISAPRSRIYPEQTPPQLLTLPSNATSIRAEITDSFTCEGRSYGYYADTDNDCQIFHVCLPVVYSHTRSQMFKWSFICPEETIFNQEIFTCVNADESIDCMESPKFYSLNSHFGERESETEEAHHVTDGTTVLPEMSQGVEKSGRRHSYDSKRKTLESVYNY